MSERKAVYGIWLKPSQMGNAISISCEIGVFEKAIQKAHSDWSFVTTNTAQKILEKNKHLLGEKTGHIYLSASSSENLVKIRSFHPLSAPIPLGLPFKQLEKTDIGIIAFTRLMQFLRKKFPNSEFTVFSPNKKMLELLRKLGFKPKNLPAKKYGDYVFGISKGIVRASDYVALKSRASAVKSGKLQTRFCTQTLNPLAENALPSAESGAVKAFNLHCPKI